MLAVTTLILISALKGVLRERLEVQPEAKAFVLKRILGFDVVGLKRIKRTQMTGPAENKRYSVSPFSSD